MSTIGTGIAAAVANTGQTAKQQTAINSGRDAQRADHAKQTDKFVSQLHEATATRDADEEMPDSQAPGYEEIYEGDAQADGKTQGDADNSNDQIHGNDAPQSSKTNVPLLPSYGPHAKEHYPLFHAIDLKA